MSGADWQCSDSGKEEDRKTYMLPASREEVRASSLWPPGKSASANSELMTADQVGYLSVEILEVKEECFFRVDNVFKVFELDQLERRPACQPASTRCPFVTHFSRAFRANDFILSTVRDPVYSERVPW